MGCRTEPAAVHIPHVLQKLHFFQFFNFFNDLHALTEKELHALTVKKNSSFFLIYTTYRKKKSHAFTSKKLHDWTIFLYTTYIFHQSGALPSPSSSVPHVSPTTG